MSEFSDLSGHRDWSTPLPWTGKPYVKTYWDWLRCCWRTDVCILLGAREEPPGKPWAERPENRGKGRAPDRERKDLSLQGHRQAIKERKTRPDRINGMRVRIRAYLANCTDATTSQIHKIVPEFSVDSVRASLYNDPKIQCLGGGKKNSESRWRLRKEEADNG